MRRGAPGVNRTLKRYTQFVLWVILAPTVGLVQAIAAFAGVMMRFGSLGNADLHRLFLGLSLIYGGGWFLPALLFSDLAMLRRPLPFRELRRYILLITVTAIVMGLVMPGMMVMLGYPTTAVVILLYGFLHRRHYSTVERKTVT